MNLLTRCLHCGKSFVPFTEREVEEASEVLALDGKDGLRTAAELVGITKARMLFRAHVAKNMGDHVTDAAVDTLVKDTLLDKFTTSELESAHA